MSCALLASKYEKEGIIMTNPAPATKRKNMNSPMLVDPARRAPEIMIIPADCEVVSDLRGSRNRQEVLTTQMAAFRPHLSAKYVMVNTNIAAPAKKTPCHLRLSVIALRHHGEAKNGEQIAYIHGRYQTCGIRSGGKVEVCNKGRLCLSALAISPVQVCTFLYLGLVR
jgi:hypothetical protein